MYGVLFLIGHKTCYVVKVSIFTSFHRNFPKLFWIKLEGGSIRWNPKGIQEWLPRVWMEIRVMVRNQIKLITIQGYYTEFLITLTKGNSHFITTFHFGSLFFYFLPKVLSG